MTTKVAQTWHGVELIVSDGNEHPVYPVVCAVHHEPGEDDAVLSVHRPVGDPVLLWEDARAIDYPLLGAFVIDSRGLHLYCVVTYREGTKLTPG